MVINMDKKIKDAHNYVDIMLSHSDDDINTIINDAANFFSDNYSEYIELCEALDKDFRFK